MIRFAARAPVALVALITWLYQFEACDSCWPCSKYPRDCRDLQLMGEQESGVYTIYPFNLDGPLEVYCDMTTDGGGWTVFQRRETGGVDFDRVWADYRDGFGDLTGEFWMGNTYLHAITDYNMQELRVDMSDWEGNSVYATYTNFHVNSEVDKLRLTVGTYEGTAGDELSSVNNRHFTTSDSDNDTHSSENCAVTYSSGFWFRACFGANVNGIYNPQGPITTYARGIIWISWKGLFYSVKATEMKMRPMHY